MQTRTADREQSDPSVPEVFTEINMMIVIFVLVGYIFHDDPKYLQVIPV